MKYFSRGKFLITGEYLVIKGATALSAPLVYGQHLSVESHSGRNLLWESLEQGSPWFRAELDPKTLSVVSTSDNQISDPLSTLLKKAGKLAMQLPVLENVHVKTNSGFKMEWGMGSSSSLISNVAYWFNIDPFSLHRMVSPGSGYDVIAARAGNPIFFRFTGDTYEKKDTEFSPSFKDRIFFVYLGKKQKTSDSVAAFRKKRKKYHTEIRMISELTLHIAAAPTLKDFEFFIREHELIISSVLKRQRVKDELFPDLAGEVKSLGAWGGDFVLLTWDGLREELAQILHRMGFETFFGFDELVYSK